MVEKIEIEVGKKKQLDKYLKIKQIIAIVVLVLYAIAAITTSVLLRTKDNKEGIAYGSQQIHDRRYIAEVTFFN